MPDHSDVDPATLHRDALVIDAAAPFLQPRLLSTYLPQVREGEIDCALATVASIEDTEYAVDVLSRWLEIERSHTHGVKVCRSVADIRAAKSVGETAIVLHMQGTNPLRADLDLINVFHALGVRVVQLTYNSQNFVGSGCLESRDSGLSSFGEAVMERLTSLNVVVDLSHAGARTRMDAARVARGPIVVTHGNARALCDNPRNLWDDEIRAIVETGGMVGLVAFPAFVSTKPNPTLDDFLDHADYITRLAGVENVGLGFDFSQSDTESYEFYGYDERFYPRPPWIYPEGIRGFADAPNVTAGLVRRGYTEHAIRGILGENFLRVFGGIWGG